MHAAPCFRPVVCCVFVQTDLTKMGVRFVGRVFLLLCTLRRSVAQPQLASYLLNVAPNSASSVAVNSENGEVFIAAGSQLLRLSRNLDLMETATVNGDLVRIALSPDGSKLVGCLGGDSRTCFVYDTSDLSSGPSATVESAHYNPDNGLAIVTTDYSFYLGSEGPVDQQGGNDNIFLAQYNYTSEVVRTTGTGRFRVEDKGFIRQFYGGVSRNGYIYYFVADRDPTNVRVLRVCDCAMEAACASTDFEALYELQVECSSSATENTRICGVDLVESFADHTGPLVVLTRCEDVANDGRNRVCGLRLDDIDSAMDTLFDECKAGTISESELPWDTSRSCTLFSQATRCNFGVPPGISRPSTTTSLFGFRFANEENSLITASLAIFVEDVSLVYVAHGGAIEVYQVETTNTNSATGIPVQTIEGVASVRDISWEEGSDNITVTTDTQVLLYPLETCSENSTCGECTAEDSYPLCGWCTVENKCSRRSQCSDGSLDSRWVQNSTKCISTTVSPSQFILDSPSILNVTASPDLPSNLNYSCSFSAPREKFPLVVPAIEVVAGSYQCNITSLATSLGSVKQATDFSFVSVEVGIPFATNENALTIFNCSAAESCVDCLDTEGACGWCLYKGICSGVPDPCPVPQGVDNSYLTLGASSEPAEVCPVLNAAPNSASVTGNNYTQPVSVARDLILQTSNLPPPVDGFRYECRINGETFVADLNTSDDTVTCRIGMPGISSGSSGDEMVPLQLIWTNDTVSYPLSQNSTNNVFCFLYNCEVLETSCSSCLGRIERDGYDCGWCSDKCAVDEECETTFTFSTTTDMCPGPMIESVLPSRGPTAGGTRVIISGTNLGASFDDILSITLRLDQEIFDINCSATDYVLGRQIVCHTPEVPEKGIYVLEVRVQRDSNVVEASEMYSYEEPQLTSVTPEFGPKSGGIMVMINGNSLSIGNRENTRVLLNRVDCKITSTNDISDSSIICTSGAFTGNISATNATSGPVVVMIDNATVKASVDIEFREDPMYTSVSPQTVIPAGGIVLTFVGSNFDVVDAPVFVYTDERLSSSQKGQCNGTQGNTMTCTLPTFNSSANTLADISYSVVFGDAAGPNRMLAGLRLEYKPDPVFATDGTALMPTEFSPGSGAALTITGMFLDSVESGEIRVTVGGEDCEARLSQGDQDRSTSYSCFVPENPPDGMNTAQVVVKIGDNLTFEVGTVTYTVEDEGGTTPPVAVFIGASCGGGVLILLILIMFFVICCVWRRATAREKKFTNLLAQMELWESEMADECKRAFTELQTDLADLVQISDDKNLPYRDFRSFAMRFLFPSAGTDHPVLNPLAVADSSEMVLHLKSFNQLILDKKFLLLFVRTLEAQQGRFTLQDKCNVASLLMVAFQNDLDYATEILQTLLKDVMHQAVLKSHPKLLLRRTETVAEKMLANWLCFLLFPYLLEHAGEPLFILFRAIKSQLEKGPVDVITGEARHSLSEEKLLRQKIECQVVDGMVETEGGDQVSVKLLDCDTVTQAKEKILDALYKNTAVSCRPHLLDVDLELRRAHAGIPLRDHDATNVKDGDWVKINTLGHYRLAEMSQAAADNPKLPVPCFRLVPRQQRPVSGMSFDHVGTIIANLNSSTAITSGPQVYHLNKPEHGDGDEGTGPRQGKILSEVFLTRLLSTKRILQPYVDDLFKGIFAVPRGKPLAKGIKFLYDFLDLQAAELGIQDPEILHTWKTNSLFLRFWVSLIKNPDFVFDIHKSATVDACLTIIAQAYIDACSTSELKYNKNTPSAKLLYVNEVRSYKQDVQQYYSTVQSLPKLSSHDMSDYLRETAQVCSQSAMEGTHADNKHAFMTGQLYFVTESALYELFKFAATYSSELQDALNDEGLSVMASKLEQLQAAIKV